MNPVQFQEANKILTPLPVQGRELQNLAILTDGQQCLSCWQMTWRERLSALFFGRVWLCIFSGPTQPAVWIDAKRKVL